MEISKKIAACVVLYHPSSEVYHNILSYYKDVDYLIVIDNTEVRMEAFEKQFRLLFPKALYLFQGRNLGIAAALNIACQTAAKAGYLWLLTMDQDSCFDKGGLKRMISDIAEIIRQYTQVGIITPFHVVSSEISNDKQVHFTEKKIAMTSGNLLNLSAYSECGDFDEKLFIDFVDYEYCLRLRYKSWKIIQDNKVLLNHSLGEFALKKLLGFKVSIGNHNYIRWYYKIRNSLYVGFKYVHFEKRFLRNVLLQNLMFEPLVVIIFFEKNKWMKLKSVFMGITDFIRGKFGRRSF